MKRVTCLVFLVGLFAVLSGCATNSFFRIENVNGVKDMPLCAEPYCSVGVFETEEIKNGTLQAVVGIYPDIRFGEFFPGRISHYCWSVSEDDYEYPCQAVFYDLAFDGRFLEAVLLKSPEKEKVIILSTFLEYGYDLNGNEFKIDREKFLKEEEYRRKLTKEKGSVAGDRQAAVVINSIQNWNRYETPQGVLLSPLGEEELKYIGSINIQLRYVDKVVGTGKFVLVPDAIGTIAGLIIDLIQARQAPTFAWSFGSLIERRQMALIIEGLAKIRKDLIETINNRNAVSLGMAENTGGWQ